MANALHPKWKEALMNFTANNNLSISTVKVALIDTGVKTYTGNTADDMYSEWSAAVVGTPQSLVNKSFTDGVFNNTVASTFTSVSGATCEALLIYIDTGTTTTSPVVAYIDTGVTGLPVTPNGGNIVISWNASGIFAL